MLEKLTSSYSDFRATVMQNSVALETKAKHPELSKIRQIVTQIANAIFMISRSYKEERAVLLKAVRPYVRKTSFFDPGRILFNHGNNRFVSGLASKVAPMLGVPADFLGLVPVSHNMSKHIYKADKVTNEKGVVIGSLSYVGDVPVLNLNGENPFETGFAQGILLADAIKITREKAELALFKYQGLAKPHEVSQTLGKIKAALPERLIQEMEGIVEGYNQAHSQLPSFKELTVNDLLYLHLIPDSMHFEAQKDGVEEDVPEVKARELAACTFIAQHDEHLGTIVARNMDWPSFNAAGTYSLIISRENPETGIRTAEITVPGLVGTLTGMNDKGLVAAMNVCRDAEEKGPRGWVPACLLTRMVLDSCQTVSEGEVFLAKEGRNALGPYHLSIADENAAISFSLQQDKEGNMVARKSEGDEPLITTNRRYEGDPLHMFVSHEREANMRAYLPLQQGRPLETVLNETLGLDYVNNELTTHSVVMLPRQRELRVSFDNAWAASQSKHSITFNEIAAC